MNGERLRAARIRAGLTQTELGQRVGLSQSMIGSLERNQRTATRETERAIADALGIPPDSLSDAEAHIQDSAEALLSHPRTPEGLRELARDRHLAVSLDIQPVEWRALRSLVLPAPATKDGYVALLMTIRLVSGGPIVPRPIDPDTPD